MSVQSQIDRLNEIKARMRTNLVAQGVTAPDDTTLDEMATLVLSVAGEDGVGISSVKQTTTSTADGGNNVVTVTLTNGTTSTFSVKNGSKGSDATVTSTSITNALGYTPANAQTVSQLSAEVDAIGTQEEIVQQVINALGTPVFGHVEEDCTIVLTSALAAGKTYTFKLEDAGNSAVAIGTYTKEADESGEVVIEWRNNIKIDKNTGVEASDSTNNYAASQAIEIKSGYTYTVYATNNTNANSYMTCSICFYGSGGNYLGNVACIEHTIPSCVISPPDGATSFKIRAWVPTNSFAFLSRISLMKEKV